MSERTVMPNEENPNAGQGPVILDIGGEIGALIVTMPSSMENLEVEIIPTGTDTRDPATLREESLSAPPDHVHPHEHPHATEGHAHDHLHDHDHHDHEPDDHEHGENHGPGSALPDLAPAPPHVAVVARPTPDGSLIYSLVYPELVEGTYDLYVRPHGRVRLTASVVGGEVTQAQWV